MGGRWAVLRIAIGEAMSKSKALEERESKMLATEFRAAEIVALVGEIDKGKVPLDVRLTGAEIAWIRLVAIAKNGADSVAVQASQILLDRTYGKATQKADIKLDTEFKVVIE